MTGNQRSLGKCSRRCDKGRWDKPNRARSETSSCDGVLGCRGRGETACAYSPIVAYATDYPVMDEAILSVGSEPKSGWRSGSLLWYKTSWFGIRCGCNGSIRRMALGVTLVRRWVVELGRIARSWTLDQLHLASARRLQKRVNIDRLIFGRLHFHRMTLRLKRFTQGRLQRRRYFRALVFLSGPLRDV